MKMEMISCIKCKKDMPKLRLEKFGYKSCIACSTTGAYRAVTTTNGEGDHTWNGLSIMTPEQYISYKKGKGEEEEQEENIS